MEPSRLKKFNFFIDRLVALRKNGRTILRIAIRWNIHLGPALARTFMHRWERRSPATPQSIPGTAKSKIIALLMLDSHQELVSLQYIPNFKLRASDS